MEVKLKLNASIEKIPEDDNKFQDWCKEKDFDYLGVESGRRAWCSDLGTYIRDNTYLVTISHTEYELSGYRFFCTQEELDQLMSGYDRPEIAVQPLTPEQIDNFIQNCMKRYMSE